MKRIFVLLMLIAAGAGEYALAGDSNTKGHLFIIGGGNRSDKLVQRYIDLAGGKDARIFIIPNASSVPETAAIEQADEFKSFGVKSVDWKFWTREQAMDEQNAAQLDAATGIFFTGGDQARLTAMIAGTPVLRKIKELYARGAVIGGTSAGAAVMSKIMITGDELLNKDSTNAFIAILKGNIKTIEGFGFLENVIIDQHFVKRKRNNRLVSVVLENPKIVGVGIDESTAVIVMPDGTFEVAGNSSVVVYDARKSTAIGLDERGHIGGSNLTMSVLLDGDRYDPSTGVVVPRRVDK